MVKKSAPTTTGVEKIIAGLQKNKDGIGAIVVAVYAKPGKKVIADDGDKTDGLRMSADITHAKDDEERASSSAGTILIKGLVADLHAVHCGTRRGLFG